MPPQPNLFFFCWLYLSYLLSIYSICFLLDGATPNSAGKMIRGTFNLKDLEAKTLNPPIKETKPEPSPRFSDPFKLAYTSPKSDGSKLRSFGSSKYAQNGPSPSSRISEHFSDYESEIKSQVTDSWLGKPSGYQVPQTVPEFDSHKISPSSLISQNQMLEEEYEAGREGQMRGEHYEGGLVKRELPPALQSLDPSLHKYAEEGLTVFSLPK